jgi:aspartyl/glutamyl-tRNA(Asn/Gln) amidotransferase C subunit
MKITREDVMRVADLAYLDLSESELETYRAQIDEILEYIGKLNELDTENVEPMAQVLADDQLATVLKERTATNAGLKPGTTKTKRARHAVPSWEKGKKLTRQRDDQLDHRWRKRIADSEENLRARTVG